MDITPILNQKLSAHNSPHIKPYVFSLESLNNFLQEAYRINGHITELTRYLRIIRAPYLALGSHRHGPSYPSKVNGPRGPATGNERQITDSDRNRIEEETKDLISGIAKSIHELSENSKIQSQASAVIAQKARSKRGLGALGRWAAGGAAVARTPEEQAQDSREEAIRLHREAVVYYLQRRLESVSKMHREMISVRLQRTVERNKSLLYQAGLEAGPLGQTTSVSNSLGHRTGLADGPSGSTNAVLLEEEDRRQQDQDFNAQFSPEQIQEYEQEQTAMIKQYNSELQKIRAVQKSLAEISDLQTDLAQNLQVQSEQINQLVQESYMTVENVGSGNKELKKASERKSTARMVFWATCAYCLTLIVWDLLI